MTVVLKMSVSGAALVTLVFTIALKAQSNQNALAFEVASVKPNISRTERTFIDPLQPGGRFTATNFTLGQLIRLAYRLQPYQVVGGPPWVEASRFDILAKANRAFTSSEVPVLLRNLLAERFKLGVHTEARDVRVYALTVVKRGRLGTRITATKEDCASLLANGPPAAPENGKVPPCASETRAGRQFIGHGVTMPQFAHMLSFQTHATVVDDTGLGGAFDIELDWVPDVETSPASGGAATADGVSIFTAVQEQLGLKLERRRGPVSVLVIDHAEAPAPD